MVYTPINYATVLKPLMDVYAAVMSFISAIYKALLNIDKFLIMQFTGTFYTFDIRH